MSLEFTTLSFENNFLVNIFSPRILLSLLIADHCLFFKLMTLGSGPDSKSKYKRSRGRDNGAGIIGKRKRKRSRDWVRILS